MQPESVRRIRLMKSPSTVIDGGDSVIMPLAKIHATPASGINPSTKESTRIIRRKLPPLFFQVRIFFAVFTPKLVAGAADEYIFQRRLTHRNRLNLARKRLDQIGHEAVTLVLLNSHLAAVNDRLHTKTRSNMFGQQVRVDRSIEQDHVAANLTLQLRRRSQCDYVAFTHNGQPVKIGRAS